MSIAVERAEAVLHYHDAACACALRVMGRVLSADESMRLWDAGVPFGALEATIVAWKIGLLEFRHDEKN